MEGNKRIEKRGAQEIIEESEGSSKKQKVPALASAIVEALNLDSFQRLCSSIEPLFRRIVSEEVERALTKLERPKLTERSFPQKIGGRKLQLHFRSRLPPHLFTGAKIEGDQGTSIEIILLDALTGTIIQSGPESTFKLSIVVLEGNFNDNVNDNEWSKEHFESFIVKEREGKRPLLNGDSQVTLKDGVGTLGELSFTDNSSWIRSRKFRLGVKVADGLCEGVRVLEAKSEAFAVKDHRGELYKKHYPPALSDEVWRLDRIAKDGALHKKLMNANVITVEDFLRFLVRDQQKLRNILGSGMSNRMWDNTVAHAKTCVLNRMLYVYYNFAHTSTITGAIFNSIYELRGIINANGQFLSIESISHDHMMLVDLLVKRAYENWNDVIEYDGGVQPLSSVTTFSSITKNQLNLMPLKHSPYVYCLEEEDIRAGSSEILKHEDMQHMLRSFASADLMAIDTSSTDQVSNSSYDLSDLDQSQYFQSKHKKKAAVCWLKLKAAFRWGIFVRKRAAESRATMVQLAQ